MIYNKIKILLNQKNLTIDALSEKIDMTASGFHYAVKNKSLKVKDLQKIAEVLEVPVAYFFEEGEPSPVKKNISNNLEAENKKLLIENSQLKDEISKLKDKIINLIENK